MRVQLRAPVSCAVRAVRRVSFGTCVNTLSLRWQSNGSRNALVRRLAYVMAVERGEEDPLVIPPEDCELMTKDQLATALAKRGFDVCILRVVCCVCCVW